MSYTNPLPEYGKRSDSSLSPVRRRTVRPEDYIRRPMVPTSLDMNSISPWEQHNYRNRHGRGQRQPMFMRTLPAERTSCGMVERIMTSCYRRLMASCPEAVSSVQWCLDDVPSSDPVEWEPNRAPLSRAFEAENGDRAKIVIYWLVVKNQAQNLADMEALIHDEMVLRLAELTGMDPLDIDTLWIE